MRKRMRKVMAAVLCSTMVLSLCGFTASAAEPARPVKDETIYVIADAEGKQEKLIVNDRIHPAGSGICLYSGSSR